MGYIEICIGINILIFPIPVVIRIINFDIIARIILFLIYVASANAIWKFTNHFYIKGFSPFTVFISLIIRFGFFIANIVIPAAYPRDEVHILTKAIVADMIFVFSLWYTVKFIVAKGRRIV